jgi:prevent-host-death family protein
VAEAGVRELKTHAAEIIRNVRERRARYIITYRGRPVAVIAPVDAGTAEHLQAPTGPSAEAWEELTRLGAEIGRRWRSRRTATELLSAMRR